MTDEDRNFTQKIRKRGQAPTSDLYYPSKEARFTFKVRQPTTSLNKPKPTPDALTGLSSLTTLHDEVGRIFGSSEQVSCFYVNLPNARIVEDRYGWEALEALLGAVSTFLRRETARIRKDRGLASLNQIYADDFVLITPATADDESLRADLAEGLTRHLRVLDEDLASIGQVFVGLATVQPLPRIHLERLVLRTILQAQQDSMDVGRQITESKARLLERAIDERAFVMHFQPIVEAATMGIFGQEALVRCQRSEFANPYVLFDVAEKTDRLQLLTRHLRRLTVDRSQSMPEGQVLFLNLHPLDLEDPELYNPPDWLEAMADRTVLEITERAGIEDFAHFRKRLEPLRELGFLVAIDDLGSGYSSLNNVAELEPDVIKLDILLIRGIEHSKVRRNLVRQLVSFANGIGCRVVAEGIETQEQMEVVTDLGCHLLQGFYLARPSPAFFTQITFEDQA